VAPGGEAEALSGLPTNVLAIPNVPNDPNDPNDPNYPKDLKTFHRWGVRTLGALAALPAGEVAARLGQRGVWWQRAARGEDPGPFVPAGAEERFAQALDLEWPIEGLEPLSFVLGRLLEPLAAHLERRDRGAAVLRVHLHLVTREVHARVLQLPVPMRDARTLRTLILLDLESHPPQAAIDRVAVAVDPTPARIVQGSLISRPHPAPEQIATLMARLHALMGETRCAAPAAVDSWEPGACAMTPFTPQDVTCARDSGPGTRDSAVLALRRFRVPIVARVRVEAGRPSRVVVDRREITGGDVERCAGPWRTSGAWWKEAPWDREEWDVALAGSGTYRIFLDRCTNTWFVEGQVD
jgi:protein ImuB